MDCHGIPIVTSNDVHSQSTFTIPPCIYSIECPESKRFEGTSQTTTETITQRRSTTTTTNDAKNANVALFSYEALLEEDDDDEEEENGAVLIPKHIPPPHPHPKHHAHNLKEEKEYWENVVLSTIPSCTYTKPIPVVSTTTTSTTGTSTTSAQSSSPSTTTAACMNAIGHDPFKKWDAIMSIRYYNIIQRNVQIVQSSSKVHEIQEGRGGKGQNVSTSSSTVLITTTITTVADIQLQITPTAKPFTSYDPSNDGTSSYDDRSMKNEIIHSPWTKSSSFRSNHNKNVPTTTHYNYSITLYAKSYTHEYNLQEKEQEDDILNMNGQTNKQGHESNTSSSTSTRTTNILQKIRKYQKKLEHPMYTWSDVMPQIMFSSNENKYISCIIPHPIVVVQQQSSSSSHNNNPKSSLSSIVIFTLDWKTKRTTISSDTSTTGNQHPLSPHKSTSINRTIVPTTKIPIPSYVQAIMEEEEEEQKWNQSRLENTLRTRPKKAKQISSSSPTKQQQTQQQEEHKVPQKRGSIGGNAVEINHNDDDYDDNEMLLFQQSPYIQNPRTVSIDMSVFDNHNQNDQKDDDDHITKYTKASRLLSQITTICDIHVTSKYDEKARGGSSLHNRNDWEYILESSTNDNNNDNGYHHGDKGTEAGRFGQPTKNVHPLLLAGCTDGSILLIGYKRAKLIALLHDATTTTTDSDNGECMEGNWMSSFSNNDTDADTDEEETEDYFTMIQKIGNSSWNQNQNGIQHMIFMSSPNKQEEGYMNGCHDDDRQKPFAWCGRLIVIHRNALVSFYKTQFYTLTTKQQKHKPMHPVSILPLDLKLCSDNDNDGEEDYQELPIAHGTYLDYNTVAFLIHPFYNAFQTNSQRDDFETIIQIWYIDDDPQKDGNNLVLMNELKSNDERLIDVSHGFLSMKRNPRKRNFSLFGSSSNSTTPVCVRHFGTNFKLNYDRHTNSLIVNSAVTRISKTTSNQDNGKMSKSMSVFLKPFLLLWKWRTSVTGFTLIGESYMKYSFENVEHRPFLMNDWTMVRDEELSYSIQDICICQDPSIGNALAFVTEYDDETLRKEILSIGILSPSSSKSSGSVSDLHFPSAMFLTHDCISYIDSLVVSKVEALLS